MISRFVLLSALGILLAPPAFSQEAPGEESSRNVHVLAHIPLEGKPYTTSDVELEQELSRPYAYVSHNYEGAGFFIIDLKEPSDAKVLYRWIIEDPELHEGGGMDNKYVKLRGRYYDVQSFQFRQTGPDADLGAIVFDVTGLPDASTVREVARIRVADAPRGFHNLFAYKHSDGRALLFATTTTTVVNVYDMEKAVSGDARGALVSRVPGSEPAPSVYGMLKGYHDMYVGYDPATRQDKFYGASYSAYLVYDVTRPEEPKLLTSISGAAGVEVDHTIQVSPDGRYAVGQNEWQYAPVRMWDLKPGLDGEVRTISRPIGAWNPNWKHATHNNEIRWPYVFVASFDEGLQVFNMMDPANPYTVGYYITRSGPPMRGEDLQTQGVGTTIFDGAWGVDVRNADGLIVTSGFRTGFWAFRMDGFDGWNGHQWGMPNVSSAQDWDNGPDGAPAPVS